MGAKCKVGLITGLWSSFPHQPLFRSKQHCIIHYRSDIHHKP